MTLSKPESVILFLLCKREALPYEVPPLVALHFLLCYDIRIRYGVVKAVGNIIGYIIGKHILDICCRFGHHILKSRENGVIVLSVADLARIRAVAGCENKRNKNSCCDDCK